MVGGFGLGGYESGYSSQKTYGLTGLVPTPGLQFYNYTAKTWYNISAEGYTLDGTSVYAGAIYVPTWGTAGLVAIFGGQTTTNLSGFTDGDRYLSMSNITLFDASSQSWYYQQATGNIPSQRDRFCLVGATGGDRTTFGEPNHTAILSTIPEETDTIIQKYSSTLGRLALAYMTETQPRWHIMLSAMRYIY